MLVVVLAVAVAAVVVGLLWRAARVAALAGGLLVAYLISCAVWWVLVYAGLVPAEVMTSRPRSAAAVLVAFGPPALVPVALLLALRPRRPRRARPSA